MAILNGNDILYVYSGGSGNSSGNNSIGGDPSAYQLIGLENNLFDNVTNAEATNGNVDYRCFYIFNNSIDASLVSAVLYTESEVPLGSSILLGIHQANDTQKISISQPTSGGFFTVEYDGTSIPVNWNGDLAIWGQNLQTALNTSGVVTGAAVTVSVETVDITSYSVFSIAFTNADAGRMHPLLVLTNNSLGGSPTIDIEKLQDGGPINEVATLLAVDTATPSGVSFSGTSFSSPLTIGTLRPGDGFPVWVKRTTVPGTQPLEDDGFTIRIVGNAF